MKCWFKKIFFFLCNGVYHWQALVRTLRLLLWQCWYRKQSRCKHAHLQTQICTAAFFYHVFWGCAECWTSHSTHNFCMLQSGPSTVSSFCYAYKHWIFKLIMHIHCFFINKLWSSIIQTIIMGTPVSPLLCPFLWAALLLKFSIVCNKLHAKPSRTGHLYRGTHHT